MYRLDYLEVAEKTQLYLEKKGVLLYPSGYPSDDGDYWDIMITGPRLNGGQFTTYVGRFIRDDDGIHILYHVWKNAKRINSFKTVGITESGETKSISDENNLAMSITNGIIAYSSSLDVQLNVDRFQKSFLVNCALIIGELTTSKKIGNLCINFIEEIIKCQC